MGETLRSVCVPPDPLRRARKLGRLGPALLGGGPCQWGQQWRCQHDMYGTVASHSSANTRAHRRRVVCVLRVPVGGWWDGSGGTNEGAVFLHVRYFPVA